MSRWWKRRVAAARALGQKLKICRWVLRTEVVRWSTSAHTTFSGEEFEMTVDFRTRREIPWPPGNDRPWNA